jgi:hypothetical protein
MTGERSRKLLRCPDLDEERAKFRNCSFTPHRSLFTAKPVAVSGCRSARRYSPVVVMHYSITRKIRGDEAFWALCLTVHYSPFTVHCSGRSPVAVSSCRLADLIPLMIRYCPVTTNLGECMDPGILFSLFTVSLRRSRHCISIVFSMKPGFCFAFYLPA